MIKVTQEGKRLAARYRSQVGVYADEYLATQSLADKAALAEAKVDLVAFCEAWDRYKIAKSDVAEGDSWDALDAIAAKYQVETDPLVGVVEECLRASDPEGADDEWSYRPQSIALIDELAKRGIELAKVTA